MDTLCSGHLICGLFATGGGGGGILLVMVHGMEKTELVVLLGCKQ